MNIKNKKYVLINERSGEVVFASDTREGLKTFETNGCAGIDDTLKDDTFHEYVAIGRPFALEEVQAVKRVYAKLPVKKAAPPKEAE